MLKENRLGWLSVLFYLVSSSFVANLALADDYDCSQFESWEDCEHYYKRVGLPLHRLHQMSQIAKDAYLPYDQAASGLAPKMSTVLVKGTEVKKSRLAYPDENVAFFSGWTGTPGLKKQSLLGFIYYQPSELERTLKKHPHLIARPYILKTLSSKRQITIAFRGSRDRYDLGTNASIRQQGAPRTDGENSPSFVHGGFLAATQSAMPEIENHLRTFLFSRLDESHLPGLSVGLIDQLLGNTEVVITGHSLGGAMAQICGYILGQRFDLSPHKPTVYTFNQPKVGGSVFQNEMDELGVRTFRIFRRTDVVQALPLSHSYMGGNYSHSKDSVSMPDCSLSSQSGRVGVMKQRHGMDGMIGYIEQNLLHDSMVIGNFFHQFEAASSSSGTSTSAAAPAQQAMEAIIEEPFGADEFFLIQPEDLDDFNFGAENDEESYVLVEADPDLQALQPLPESTFGFFKRMTHWLKRSS